VRSRVAGHKADAKRGVEAEVLSAQIAWQNFQEGWQKMVSCQRWLLSSLIEIGRKDLFGKRLLFPPGDQPQPKLE
jgi:hypothetical protein